MNIYVGTLITVAALSIVLGGTKKRNIKYILIIAIGLLLLCALRGDRVGSDLGRYETHYNTCDETEWEDIGENYDWSNFGFYYLCKFHSVVFGSSFHSFLVMLAVIQALCLTFVIYKTSVNPYLSYTMYIALGYYVFTYSGLKQAMATAFIFLAFVCILEKRPWLFTLFVLLAVTMHFPSIVFLAAYMIGRHKIGLLDTVYLAVIVLIIYLYRNQIVLLLSDAYGTVVETEAMGGVGGKIIMMIALIFIGFLLRIPQGKTDMEYSCTFNFMIIAAILQTFAVYGNVFERLADYYFVFAMFYVAFVFEKKELRNINAKGIVHFYNTTQTVLGIGLFIFALMYYYSFIGSSVGLLPYSLY